jgi:hypothetical protein
MDLTLSSRLQTKKFHTKTKTLSSKNTSCGTSASHTPSQSQLFPISHNNLHLPPISNTKISLFKYNPPVSRRLSSSSSDFSDPDDNISNELLSLNYFTGEAINFLRKTAKEHDKIREKTHSTLEKCSELEVDIKNCESALLKDRFLQARILEKNRKSPEFKCFPVDFEEKNIEAYWANKEKEVQRYLRSAKQKKTKKQLQTLAENPISFTNIPMPQRKIFR